MGGESALKQMKENEAMRHIPVMLFSANDLIEEVSNKLCIYFFDLCIYRLT